MINKIDINIIKNIALDAGKLILKIYSQDFDIEYKEDNSPLTTADIISNDFICKNLRLLYPTIPILSEENKEVPYSIRKNWEYYWCIDPIDGTKEFIKKNGEFTVNIALIYKNKPVLGVVYAPVLNDIYYAKQNSGAFKNSIQIPTIRDDEKLIIVASKSHLTKETEDFISNIKSPKIKQLVSKGSSLKLCMIASGEADIYPRLSPTKEWDTAAAHAIVLESGKNVYKFNTDEQLVYNKNNLLNPSFIVK